MGNRNKEVLLDDFRLVSNRLNSPAGFMKLVNIISERFSLELTVLLQKLGANKPLRKKHGDGQLILNIGCGDVFPSHCVNTDLAPTFGGLLRALKGHGSSNVQCYLNVLYRDRYLKGIADGVVFSHVLEHLPPHLALAALENLKFYLKPGGVLRLSVPFVGAYDRLPVPPDQNVSTPIIAKNSVIYGWGHQFMYDIELLCALLEHVGFTDVHEVAFREGPLAETDIERRAAETICVVASN